MAAIRVILEGLYHLMYVGGRFPGGSVVNAAISGIEHALWDIAGKAAGLPVYRLVGGKARDRVRVYQSVGGDSPEEAADDAIRLVQTYGYTALKMGPLPPGWHQMPWNRVLRETERRVGAVREAGRAGRRYRPGSPRADSGDWPRRATV